MSSFDGFFSRAERIFNQAEAETRSDLLVFWKKSLVILVEPCITARSQRI
jgi:hypothetical protein